jgi:hypothetical protein
MIAAARAKYSISPDMRMLVGQCPLGVSSVDSTAPAVSPVLLRSLQIGADAGRGHHGVARRDRLSETPDGSQFAHCLREDSIELGAFEVAWAPSDGLPGNTTTRVPT